MGSGTKPKRFTLRSALDCFLDFRISTIRRKSAHHLKKVSLREHIVDGLMLALDSIDEVTAMVKEAKDQTAARIELMNLNNQTFLTKEQADAVLKLKLGQLTKLNKRELMDEKKVLEKKKRHWQILFESDTTIRNLMKKEFVEMKEKFGVPRKTKIEQRRVLLKDIDLIPNSKSVIVVTRGGYIKRMPLKTFENQQRGTQGKKGMSRIEKFSKDNEVTHFFSCSDHDTLLMITQKGIAFGLRAFQIPTSSRAARGIPIPSVLSVKVNDIITSVLPVDTFAKNEYCLLLTKNGWIKKTPLISFNNLSSRGLVIATLDSGDSLRWFQKCTDNDEILIGSSFGKAIRFKAREVRPTSRASRGVQSMKLKDEDNMADMNILKGDKNYIDKPEYVLAITADGYGKRVETREFRIQARGGTGVIAIKFKEHSVNKKLICLRIVHEDDEILAISTHGNILRQKVKNIPIQRRSATGVMVQKVNVEARDTINSVGLVPRHGE